MPSAGAWARGQRAAAEIIKQHQASNNGKFPETVAVTLWGLDAIKTRGESVAIVLALVGAKPVKEGTGRIVRYDLIPLEELGRPRIDVLASLSGIFRLVPHPKSTHHFLRIISMVSFSFYFEGIRLLILLICWMICLRGVQMRRSHPI